MHDYLEVNRHDATADAQGSRRSHACWGKAVRVRVDEFLDDFYLSHPDKARQQPRIDEAPDPIGKAADDAWLGAVGEHLANRWGLLVPSWTMRQQHFALTEPLFVPNTRALKPMLLAESPPAFRSRNIFTVAEPLQRARFPRGATSRQRGRA
jgi:hypothetical protein